MDPTAPLQQPVEIEGNVVPHARKRRRRTAGGGSAMDDCFTCRKRAVKCDRKRPYCSQCIEIGKDCTGYKTTLTWGVGVASRGKLRGMSYPIVSPGNKSESNSSRHASISAGKPERIGSVDGPFGASAIKQEPPNSFTSFNTPLEAGPMDSKQYSDAQQPYRPPAMPIPIQQQSTQWQSPVYGELTQGRQISDEQYGNSFQQRLPGLQIPNMPPPMDMMQASSGTSTVGSYAESEYHTPLEYPRTPRSAAHPESFHQRSMSYSWPDMALSASSSSGFAARDDSISNFHHQSASSIDDASQSMSFNSTTFMRPGITSSPVFDETDYNNASGMGPFGEDMSFPSLEASLEEYEQNEEQNSAQGMSLMDSRFSNPFFHTAPRLQSLMTYYSHHICPYIVAFDGPANPYRRHILQLAVQNEGLQHALAALSTNNQRMRRVDSYQSGFVEEIPPNGMESSVPTKQELGEPSTEESMYKQMSIDELNMQLTDSRAAQDDSVLATLLVLCLFHVSDSGFSKFKTQLAGVQKLLSLRNPSVQSDFTRWVEMFFIWFDVMTSTVNDREMQITRESLAMLDYSANLGALEQYSGVDGRLFKLIARLGRLNLLAQGRPVRGQTRQPQPTASFARPSKPAVKREQFFQPGFNPSDYDNLDGNGWGQPISAVDDSEQSINATDRTVQFPSSMSPPSSSFSPSTGQPFDDRHDFWAEWHDLRTRLQTWTMPPPSSSTPGNNTTIEEEGQRDLIHINESFRYSALLYTERLGNPVLPSSHDQFQFLVSQALFHITALAVTSCVNKFLLWPLFITGTECVDEGHRNIIRLRCRKIMEESGFYNNLSTLDLLERVWGEAGWNVRGREEAEMHARRRESTAGSRTGRYGQAFRWRKAMDRVDGEYIVI